MLWANINNTENKAGRKTRGTVLNHKHMCIKKGLKILISNADEPSHTLLYAYKKRRPGLS
ncbi:MAG: hypothetical protein BGO69_18945 [Bacteroidetes bacterium 46-16]|nr:MAG: hypothetical protein BGO69_18945 [Bacteroidetes bacterium 46-16]